MPDDDAGLISFIATLIRDFFFDHSDRNGCRRWSWILLWFFLSHLLPQVLRLLSLGSRLLSYFCRKVNSAKLQSNTALIIELSILQQEQETLFHLVGIVIIPPGVAMLYPQNYPQGRDQSFCCSSESASLVWFGKVIECLASTWGNGCVHQAFVNPRASRDGPWFLKNLSHLTTICPDAALA